jgi:nucleoside-diphosphate-sugar epimerase
MAADYPLKEYATKCVSILGCGWLGFPLAEALHKQGFQIKASTTHPEKVFEFRNRGFVPYLIECCPQVAGEGCEDFFQSPCLVITLPYKRSFADPAFYFDQIRSVVDRIHAAASNVFVIFISSTAVYPQDLKDAREDAVFVPENRRAEILLIIENFLLKEMPGKATILRLAGLYGGDRRIGKFLSGQSMLPDAEQPVNLVHRDDGIAVICRVILLNARGEIFNVCGDGHPSRRVLYTTAARQMGLPPPVFQENISGKRYKVVSNQKLKDRLGVIFRYPDPLAYVQAREDVTDEAGHP